MATIAGDTYSQTGRPLALTTNCGTDVLLVAGFTGHEGISQLFQFSVEAIVPQPKLASVNWKQLLGKPATLVVKTPDGEGDARYFNGICSRVAQGSTTGGEVPLTNFRLEIVPKLWLLTRRATSQVFHQKPVKDIVLKILASYGIAPGNGLDWQATEPKEPRDYCVQYRETDLNFVSRLLEDEGLCYYFTHANGNHTMVVTEPPKTFPTVNPAKVRYHDIEGGVLPDDVVWSWEKTQELRSEKYALWDYCFEKTGDNFESKKPIADTIQVGAVSHSIKLGNDGLELYDYPGEFAQRFDGIDKSGGEQASEIGKISTDGNRVAQIRIEEEAAASLLIHGSSCCRQFVAGSAFTLDAALLPHASGDYVLTSIEHVARQKDYVGAADSSSFEYQNTFTCIPAKLNYRPARLTPKPVIHGTQTAVVVGATSSDEIFTDKYGRVKVQFNWDREGKRDADSSCWIRVGTAWAGTQWGTIHIPRVGQEVIVAFEEGDPDQPIIVGSVYNDKHMPPYLLPDNMTQSGIKSRSSLKGTAKNFNELRFEDKIDNEHIYFHAERDFDRVVENNDTLKVGFDKKTNGDQTIDIFNNQTTNIGTKDAEDGSQAITIFNNQTLKIGDPQAKDGSQTIEVYKDRTETVKTGNETVTIEQGNREITVQQGNDTHNINTGNRTVEIAMGNDALTIKMGNQSTKLNLGESTTEAMQSITLKVGQSSLVIDQMGVTIKGMNISIDGQVQTEVKGTMATLQGSAMTTVKGGITMIN